MYLNQDNQQSVDKVNQFNFNISCLNILGDLRSINKKIKLYYNDLIYEAIKNISY